MTGGSVGEDVAAERRRMADRRGRPTPFWSVLRPGGRRRGFRRVEEGRNRYVDCPSAGIIILSLLTVLLSILDAFFTLLHIEEGGREINPIMGLALLAGVPLFLALKTSLTGLGVFFLAIHQNFRLGRAALLAVALVYAGLLAYHVVLFLRGGHA